jgi:predicted Na+-dependent transporter
MESEPVATQLSYWAEVLFAALGVALSVLLPVLVALVKRYWPETEVRSATDVWRLVLPYVVLGVFSLGVALVVAAAADFDSGEAAVMAGFAWDKTVEVAASVLRPGEIPPVLPASPPGVV